MIITDSTHPPVGRTAVTILIPLSIATPVFDFAWEHRLTTIHLDTWQAILLLFIGQEFCYYWFHRASHRVRWFWGNHSVHHSPNQLNLSAAYRTGMFAKLIGSPIFFAPMAWLGFPPKVVVATLSLNLLYQFWIHATWILILNARELADPHHDRFTYTPAWFPALCNAICQCP